MPVILQLAPGDASGSAFRPSTGPLPAYGPDEVVTTPPSRIGAMLGGLRRGFGRDESRHHFGLALDKQ
jgi:hypothetical protein